MNPVSIQVDDRESRTQVADLLQLSPEFRVTVTRLKLGDYCVDGRLLFERKTLTDLVVAIIDGRLFGQAIRLAAARLRPAIILEGTSRDLGDSGMRWESIQGALVAVTLFCGVPLLRTRTPEETVKTMLFAAQQAQACTMGGIPRHGWRPRGKFARQLYILQGLPSIGPERARRLLARFGSVKAIVNARPEELRSVGGVGKRVVEKLRWSVEERLPKYSSDSGFGTLDPAKNRSVS